MALQLYFPPPLRRRLSQSHISTNVGNSNDHQCLTGQFNLTSKGGGDHEKSAL